MTQFDLDVAEIVGTTRHYGMFTQEGNTKVQAIVDHARQNKSTWGEVNQLLEVLSQLEAYREATDTEVRECVWVELEFV